MSWWGPSQVVDKSHIDYWLPLDIKDIDYNTTLLEREAWWFNKLAAIIEAANRAAELL